MILPAANLEGPFALVPGSLCQVDLPEKLADEPSTAYKKTKPIRPNPFSNIIEPV